MAIALKGIYTVKKKPSSPGYGSTISLMKIGDYD